MSDQAPAQGVGDALGPSVPGRRYRKGAVTDDEAAHAGGRPLIEFELMDGVVILAAFGALCVVAGWLSSP